MRPAINNPKLIEYAKKNNIPIEIYSNFTAYCLWIMPTLDQAKPRQWLPFQLHLMEVIDQIIEKGYGTIVVEMPPRMGKTQICGKLFISYMMGMYPKQTGLFTTHSSDRAEDFTKMDLMPLLHSYKYKIAFPTVRTKYALDGVENTQSIKEQRKSTVLSNSSISILKYNGQYRAKGGGQTITGIKAHYIVCDDYFGKYEDAQSLITRTKRVRWYNNDVCTRAEAQCIKIICSTRYHHEDIIGDIKRVAQERAHLENDYIPPIFITYRAEAIQDNEFEYDNRKKGELLVKEFKDQWLNQKYASPREWSCLYQSIPYNEEGIFLRPEYLVTYTHPVKTDRVYISVDANLNANALQGDCAGITVWQVENPNKYLLEFVNERLNSVQLIDKVKKLIDKYPNYCGVVIEGAANGYTLYDHLIHEGIPRVLRPIKVNKNKVERFQYCLSDFHSGNILVPHSRLYPDIYIYVSQLLNFTGAKNGKDDLVDSTSLILNYLRDNIIRVGSGEAVYRINNNRLKMYAPSISRIRVR